MPVQVLRYDQPTNLLVPVLGGGSRQQYIPTVPPYDGPDPALWAMDLDENFTGTTLNSAVWNVTNSSSPVSNHWGVWRASNIVVSGGNLQVLSKQETIQGSARADNPSGTWPWTTGNIQSYPTSGSSGGVKYRTWSQYFRAEIRAKAPLEQGFWPAPLWFRPVVLTTNNTTNGEIDVYEGYSYHNPPRSTATLHDNFANNRHLTKYRYFNTLSNPDAVDWHTWVVEKIPGQMRFWVDGLLVGTFGPADLTWYNTIFEAAGIGWCPRITMQIKQNWSGADEPDATTRWASQYSTMLVDYVRIWDYIGA